MLLTIKGTLVHIVSSTVTNHTDSLMFMIRHDILTYVIRTSKVSESYIVHVVQTSQ